MYNTQILNKLLAVIKKLNFNYAIRFNILDYCS